MIYLQFPITLFALLFISSIFVWVFKKFLILIGTKNLIPVLYISVHLHELCHYLMAILCLKWPKYEGVKVIMKNNKIIINGRVSHKIYKYKDLIYNIVNGSFVVETIHLIHQLISGFLIGLAPIVVPYAILYYFLSLQNIDFVNFNIITAIEHVEWWQYIILVPFMFFGALIASPSWAYMKSALPILVILLYIKVPVYLTNFLHFSSYLLLLGAVIFGIIDFFLYIKRIREL